MNLIDKKIEFTGVKIALINNGRVLTILRDNKPEISYPNFWDFPGGGRENDETPFECVQREVWEELKIRIKKSDIVWAKQYPGMIQSGTISIFMVSYISQLEFEKIVFGDEGQKYELRPIKEVMKDTQMIDSLKLRLQDYIEAKGEIWTSGKS